MAGDPSHNASHVPSEAHGDRQVQSRVALGATLVLFSLTAAGLLASPRASFAHNLVVHRRLLSPAQDMPQLVRTTIVSTSNPFTGPTTATALLPIMVNGYPPPYPWTGEIVATYPNCTLTRLFGFILDQHDEPVGDVWVHYWADGWDGAWAKSSWEQTGDHNWDGTLDNRPRQVVWYACVVPEKKRWECQSNTVEAPTSANCQKGIQVYHIDFLQN